jgi:hypothetical protein
MKHFLLLKNGRDRGNGVAHWSGSHKTRNPKNLWPTKERLDVKKSNHACGPPPYLAKKAEWKAANRSATASMSSSGGRKVVLKCCVPPFWPKPLPAGSTHNLCVSSKQR